MLSNYLTIAFRNLSKNRSFAVLNIVGLGLSVACCILIFMLVRHHLSFDDFHAKRDRIGIIGTETRLEQVDKEGNVPYPMGASLRQEYAFLEKTAMIAERRNSLITIAAPGQAPAKFSEPEGRAFAEPSLFDILDFPMVKGNMEEFHQPYTALLTEKMARKYYGSNEAALGNTFKVNNRDVYRVVGILKDLPDNSDLRQFSIFTSWATFQSDSNSVRMLNNWGGINGGTQCFVLFREGAQYSELETAFTSFRDKYHHPEVTEWWYHVIPLAGAHFNTEYGYGVNKSRIWALALIGLFLLITACVNFINMATAQALNRAREVGVRKTMGSTRGQLFWQFMGETGLIVCISVISGLFAARLTLPWLNQLADTHISFNFVKDLGLYGFLSILTLALAFLSGAYPGLALSGFRPVESLKGDLSRQQVGGFSLRRVLVGTQFAISQALIIGAVVVAAQMEYTRNADLGFQRTGIVNIDLPRTNGASKSSLKQQLATIPGVEKVSLCMQPPASDANWNTRLTLQGRSEPESWPINVKFVDTEYLETFGMKLIAGRNLQMSDTVREYLINEEVATKLGLSSPEEIIGKSIDIDHVAYPVVGVIRNFHNRSFHEDIQPQVVSSDLENYNVIAVRLNPQSAHTSLKAIEQAWSALFPDYVFKYDFMDERLSKFYENESIVQQLARVFAGIAIFIGCLGLYGLSAFMVARKTKEIGIRKTLGAGVGSILWLFGKEYGRLILAAFIVAAPLAWKLMNTWLDEYAYRITIGAGIFALSLFVTIAIAATTVGFQSLRAALANPVKSLRSE